MKKISIIALSLILTSGIIFAQTDIAPSTDDAITVPVPDNNIINVETTTEDGNLSDIIAEKGTKIEEVQEPAMLPEDEGYDEYSDYAEEDIPFEDNVNTEIIEKNEVVVLPADSKLLHPLLSMNFDDSLFNKLSEMEKEKFTIDIQTKTKQAELELAKLKRDQLKIDSEIAKLEGKTEAPTQQAPAPQITEETTSAPAAPEKSSSEETVQTEDGTETNEVTGNYELKSITGIGGNLIATLKNVKQNKKINVRVGTKIGDNIIVKSISATDGLQLEKDKKLYPLKIQQE